MAASDDHPARFFSVKNCKFSSFIQIFFSQSHTFLIHEEEFRVGCVDRVPSCDRDRVYLSSKSYVMVKQGRVKMGRGQASVPLSFSYAKAPPSFSVLVESLEARGPWPHPSTPLQHIGRPHFVFEFFSNSKHLLFYDWIHLKSGLNQGAPIKIEVDVVWKKKLLAGGFFTMSSVSYPIHGCIRSAIRIPPSSGGRFASAVTIKRGSGTAIACSFFSACSFFHPVFRLLNLPLPFYSFQYTLIQKLDFLPFFKPWYYQHQKNCGCDCFWLPFSLQTCTVRHRWKCPKKWPRPWISFLDKTHRTRSLARWTKESLLWRVVLRRWAFPRAGIARSWSSLAWVSWIRARKSSTITGQCKNCANIICCFFCISEFYLQTKKNIRRVNEFLPKERSKPQSNRRRINQSIDQSFDAWTVNQAINQSIDRRYS